ncbi:Myblike DNAbinding domain-containing protein [Modicella reniformis]|uniref:Myblike DNAbinding domain-containing protein n=1 Tax=Modicella reniformis TaxID=1440133 RepID=A0A9P6M8G2_9FUNG|nr:Myblike DNAbinding domain-containing protein [Modicella reniformis]
MSNHSTVIQDQASSSAQIVTDIEEDVTSSATSGTATTTTTTTTTTSKTALNTSKSISNPSYNTRLQKPQFTPEIDAKILQLREQGYSWTAVGSALGLSHRSCHRRYFTVLDPNLEERWSESKVRQMEDLVVQGKSWSEMASIFGNTSTNCQVKWNSLFKSRTFDIIQSKVLLKLVEEHGEKNWKAVMQGFMFQLGGRDMAKVTPEQLKHQYYRLLRQPTHVWTIHEETALIQHVLKHGTHQWDVISEALQIHTPEQCKAKWIALDMKAKIPKDKLWYKGERSNFWRLWLRYGDDWNTIARFLPKRSAEQCQALFEKITAKFRKADNDKDKDKDKGKGKGKDKGKGKGKGKGKDKYNQDDDTVFREKVTEFAKNNSDHITLAWKKEDSQRLWQVVQQFRLESPSRRVLWKKVGDRMNMGLLPAQYKHHHYYLNTVNKVGLSGVWTEDDIERLQRVVQVVGRNWVRISKEFMPHRNPKSLCHKFASIEYKGSHISPMEYDRLMSEIEIQEEEFNRELEQNQNQKQEGSSSRIPKFTPDWGNIAKAMPGGSWTPAQCQISYESSFKNHINSEWTPEQDENLLRAVQSSGRKNWFGVAQQVAGKDTWDCRMRWSLLHDSVLEDKESEPALANALRRNRLTQLTV